MAYLTLHTVSMFKKPHHQIHRHNCLAMASAAVINMD
jgi:hypothetical protein